MSDKSDTPRTDAAEAWLITCRGPGRSLTYATVDKNDTLHWPLDQWATVKTVSLVRESELAAVTEERDALAAAMPSEGADAALAYAAEKTLREKAEAECERLRDALQVCLSYWLSDANPDELQGSVAHMKHISGFAAAIDAARRK